MELKEFLKKYKQENPEHRDVKINRRGQLEYIRKDGSLAVESINLEPTMTQQQFKDECDINVIIEHYARSGELPVHQKTGYFMDAASAVDYKESLDMVIKAQDAFMELPAQLRNKFENDPAKLLEFVSDIQNKDKAIEYGLISKKTDSDTDKLIKAIKESKNDEKLKNDEQIPIQK